MATYRETTVITTSTNRPVYSRIVYRGFLDSVGGGLTLLQLIMGIVVFVLTFILSDKGYSFNYYRAIYCLHLTSFAFSLISLLVILAACVSATGTMLPHTLFYVLYHITAFFMYLIPGILVLIDSNRQREQSYLIAAAVIAMVLSCFHLIHGCLAQRRTIWASYSKKPTGI